MKATPTSHLRLKLLQKAVRFVVQKRSKEEKFSTTKGSKCPNIHLSRSKGVRNEICHLNTRERIYHTLPTPYTLCISQGGGTALPMGKKEKSTHSHTQLQVSKRGFVTGVKELSHVSPRKRVGSRNTQAYAFIWELHSKTCSKGDSKWHAPAYMCRTAARQHRSAVERH